MVLTVVLKHPALLVRALHPRVAVSIYPSIISRSPRVWGLPEILVDGLEFRQMDTCICACVRMAWVLGGLASRPQCFATVSAPRYLVHDRYL